MVDDISHEGLRALLREEGVTFQRIKTWKASKDPDYAVKKARVEHLYAIADREVVPEPGDPEMIFCVDEFGPLNLQPRPGLAVGRGQRQEQGPGPCRVPRRAVTGMRSSAIQGDGKRWPEPAHSRMSVEDRFCGAPVARITVIR